MKVNRHLHNNIVRFFCFSLYDEPTTNDLSDKWTNYIEHYDYDYYNIINQKISCTFLADVCAEITMC